MKIERNNLFIVVTPDEGKQLVYGEDVIEYALYLPLNFDTNLIKEVDANG